MDNIIEFLKDNIFLEVFKYFFIAIGSYYLFDNWLGYVKRKVDTVFRKLIPNFKANPVILEGVEHRIEIIFNGKNDIKISKGKILSKRKLLGGSISMQIQNENGIVSELFGVCQDSRLIIEEYEKDKLSFPIKVSSLRKVNYNGSNRLEGTSSYLQNNEPIICITIFDLIPYDLDWYLEKDTFVKRILTKLQT